MVMKAARNNRGKCSVLVLLFCVCMALTACGKHPGREPIGEDGTVSNEDFVCLSMFGSFFTENYVLYHDNHFRLQFFDVSGKTDIVFCFTPGCSHEEEKRSVTGEVLEKGCIAYDFSRYTVMLQGDYCYFLDNETGEVVRSDARGENRKVVGRIPLYILPDGVFFSENALYVTYCNNYEMIETKDENGEIRWIVGDAKEKRLCGILRVDLADGRCTEVFQAEEYSALIQQYDVRGNHLYFQYSYYDIPYINPNMETTDSSVTIPEGLTAENYWEEMPKHAWYGIYDYNITTGELRVVAEKQQSKGVFLCKDFYAVAREETTELYRYTGEYLRKLDFSFGRGVRSDSGLICNKGQDTVLVDETTGEIVKQSTISADQFVAHAIIGESCYGYYRGESGWSLGYLPTKDFWENNLSNAVVFAQREMTSK